MLAVLVLFQIFHYHALGEPQRDPDFLNRRGKEHFAAGRVKEAVADYDKAIELEPALAPHHWKRGIALYLAGRYEDCARQFELHRTVNPEDAENAMWHAACVARIHGLPEARKRLIPTREDDRIPMMELYRLYQGQSTPQKVLDAARAGAPGNQLTERLFYAHLYIGLWYAAQRNAKASMEHLRKAASDYPVAHFMWTVAKVSVKLIPSTLSPAP
jgi:lipoprotein NlpI